MQIADILAAQGGIQVRRHRLLRHAEQRGLGAIHMHNQTFGRSFHRVIDIDNIRGGAENFPHLLGDLNLAGIVQPVHLGDQWRHHRRAGRHFHHFDVGVVFRADFLQGAAHRQGNGVALPVAVFFVHQIDLNIADVRPGAQIILPD